MRLLYITEDYSASKVHHELLSRICKHNFEAKLYTVIRYTQKENDIRSTYLGLNYDISAFSLPKWLLKPYRLIYGLKKWLKLHNLLVQIEPSQFDIIHAANVFSDGVIAYELWKRYNIPYTVAVRATDINLYISKMPHCWSIGRKILSNSSKIIFISPILKEKFFQKKPIKSLEAKIKTKCVVIPNGIEDFWIQNQSRDRNIEHPNKILYVGRFDKNKNVESLIKAVLNLREQFPDIKLTLVGGGDKCHNDILAYCKEFPDNLEYLGKIYDKDKLRDVMRQNHIFAMVSHSETFGLVYLEALSQHLPILYTRGQGIDKSIEDDAGEKADSHSTDEIAAKLRKLLLNYSNYTGIDSHLDDFSWDSIATKYCEIFNEIKQSHYQI